MKKINWIVVVFIGLLFAHIAYADIDPWYLNNPSCVIDRGNPARTGEYLTQPVEKFHGVKWMIYGAIITPPICYQNLLVSIPDVINMTNGKHIWSVDTPAYSGEAIVYHGVVYATIHEPIIQKLPIKPSLVGYDAKTGKIVFQLPQTALHEEGYFSPLIYNNIAYFDLLKSVVACDLKTQKIIWRFNIGEDNDTAIQASPLSTDGKRIYFSNWKNKIYALDIRTGKLIWSYTGAASGMDYISVYQGRVYLCSNSVYAFDATTGKLIWRRYLKNGSGGTPTLSQGMVFISAIGTGLYALDAITGKEVWYFPKEITGSPVIAGNILYVKSNHNLLYAINKKTGEAKWHYDTKDDGMLVQGSIMPYRGVVYVNGGSGRSDTNIIAIY